MKSVSNDFCFTFLNKIALLAVESRHLQIWLKD